MNRGGKVQGGLVALQHGVPLETYVEKFTNLRFEPAGMTDDPDVRMAQSIMDYVFRRLALDYLDFDTRSFMGIHTAEERSRQLETGSYAPQSGEGEDEESMESQLESYSQSIAPAAAKRPEGSTSAQQVEAADTAVEGEAAADAQATVAGNAQTVAAGVHSSAELMEAKFGKAADAPLCMTCGIKMRPAGSCHICEGCGSTSGCS